MPDIIIAVGVIGLAVSVSTPASATDVPGLACSEIGSFAQRVAQQKTAGVALTEAVRRLRRSFGREQADTEHELEKIVRAIYEMPIFSTASPAEVGNAYQTACEKGQPRWSRSNGEHLRRNEPRVAVAPVVHGDTIHHWLLQKAGRAEHPPRHHSSGDRSDRERLTQTAIWPDTLAGSPARPAISGLAANGKRRRHQDGELVDCDPGKSVNRPTPVTRF
jgi:hypothetical protein